MKFDKRAARAILEGRKTQLRRPDKPPYGVGDKRPVLTFGARPQDYGKPCWYKTATVRITAVREQDLREVSYLEARAEGFNALEDFFTAFRDKYSLGPKVPEPVPIWVVEFELDRSHITRLLHKDSSHGYTTSRYTALPDEQEAVEDEYLQRFAQDAEGTGKLLRADQRAKDEARTQARRLRQARLSATRKGVDIDANVYVIELELLDMERKSEEAA